VRGLCLHGPHGEQRIVDDVSEFGWWLDDGDEYLWEFLARSWRVDLDAWGSVGPLLGLLGPALRSVTRERDGWRVGLWLPDARISDHVAPVLGEAAARALVEVAHGR